MRLYPEPEAISAAVCPFPDVASAVSTVIRTIQRGVPIMLIDKAVVLDDTVGKPNPDAHRKK